MVVNVFDATSSAFLMNTLVLVLVGVRSWWGHLYWSQLGWQQQYSQRQLLNSRTSARHYSTCLCCWQLQTILLFGLQHTMQTALHSFSFSSTWFWGCTFWWTWRSLWSTAATSNRYSNWATLFDYEKCVVTNLSFQWGFLCFCTFYGTFVSQTTSFVVQWTP